jgi:LEA14-like dessication related protein
MFDAAALAGDVQSQRFELDLTIYNPNNYRLDASQIRYKLAVDSVDLATGVIERRVTLKPRDSAVVRVPVEVDQRAFPRLLAGIFTKGSLSFQLSGTMRIETVLVRVTRAFDQQGTYNPLSGRVTIFNRK